MVLQSMVYSDRLLIPVIRALQAENKPTTATEISQISAIPYGTVKRRLSALERSGIIRRKRLGRRWGSYYEIVED